MIAVLFLKTGTRCFSWCISRSVVRELHFRVTMQDFEQDPRGTDYILGRPCRILSKAFHNDSAQQKLYNCEQILHQSSAYCIDGWVYLASLDLL